jgi:hypothetical protein
MGQTMSAEFPKITTALQAISSCRLSCLVLLASSGLALNFFNFFNFFSEAAEAKPQQQQQQRRNSKRRPLARMVPAAMPTAAPVRVEPALPPIPFEKIDTGTRSGIKLFRTIMFNNKTGWDRFLTLHRVPGVDRPTPLVDFEKETVIGVFAGSKPREGYSVEIKNIYRTDMGARVVYRIVTPPSGKAAEVTTQPYQMVKIGKMTGPILFIPETKSER